MEPRRPPWQKPKLRMLSDKSHYTYSPGPSDRQTAQTGRRDLQNSKRQPATSSSKTELPAWPQGQTSKRGRLPSNTKWRRSSKHHITPPPPPHQPRRHVLVAGENKKKACQEKRKMEKVTKILRVGSFVNQERKEQGEKIPTKVNKRQQR